MAEVDVFDEVLCSAGEELVRGCEVPGDVADTGIPVGRGTEYCQPGCLTEWAVKDEVVEGVGGPTAGARELVQGDVGSEPGHVVRRERMANGKLEGGGGGVP